MKTSLALRHHRLQPVRWLPSPNQDARPDGVQPRLVVVHGISLPPGEFGGSHVDDLFTNRLDPAKHPYFAQIAHLRVSAHLLIDRQGRITQYVAFNRRAWHAGLSHWRGLERCNDFSIGIELEGADWLPYTAAQYRCLEQVLPLLAQAYPIEGIAGHSEIAPGRKTDPGAAFAWHRLSSLFRRFNWQRRA
ncbi:AmpD protein [Sulfurivirga caldicuralii]|uniref:1,6-anhydro-N-acetylmuramyl-L-alanine amidase AmpD n=1 Tax=Sulfurivirga caldicuralii TaxID=364032 RepID=A0A1N6EWE1_9GAMM|nr:1,6-anhydro-N-acetylmuramyl-L-alanine amidase AmpD [Sulfurivirga caldicuralii]SIN87306.1 AmpD protein [Sulfurivirga caldicuralii]